MNAALSTLREVTLSGSILIVLLLIVRRIFKGRISARWQYAVWGLVLLRLLVPITIESAFSVMNAVEPAVHQVEQAVAIPAATSVPFAERLPFPATDTSLTEATQMTMPSYTMPPSQPAPSATPADFDWRLILLCVWIGGSLIAMVYMAYVNLVFLRCVKRKELILPPHLADIFASFGLKKPIKVYLSGNISSPCLTGWLRPAILVTPEAAADEQRLRHVLLHELCHYRQCDNWIALWRNLACAIHWFNPLVWLAASYSRRDCELSCDATVLRRLDSAEGIAYGETLLALIRKTARHDSVLRAATTMTAGKRAMKERIGMIARRPKMLRITAACVTVLVAIITVAACTGALTQEKLSFTPEAVSAGEIWFLQDGITLPVHDEGMKKIVDALLEAKLLKPPSDMDLPTSTHDIRLRADGTDYALALCEGETVVGLYIDLPLSYPIYWIEDDALNQAVWDAAHDNDQLLRNNSQENLPVNLDTVSEDTAELFIEKLDKQTDPQIREAYEYRPEGFMVEAIYDGTFSGSGRPEKLAVIKVGGQPHAGGLDAHIGAVYDAETMENVSAMYFATDQFAYRVETGANGQGYFIYVGYWAGTGLFSYDFGLYEMGSPWVQVSPYEANDSDAALFVLDAQGTVTVYRNLLPEPQGSRMLMVAEPDYTLAFDPEMRNMAKANIPDAEKDTIYHDIIYDFRLTIPASWRRLYTIDIVYNDLESTVIFNYAKAKKPADLFTLSVRPKRSGPMEGIVLQTRLFPTTGEHELVLMPTDALLADEAHKDAFAAMIQDIPAIVDSFSTGDPGLISKPTLPLIVPEPEPDTLGLSLPEPNEYGQRLYRWNDQPVEDWLSDLPEAPAIRNMMLPLLDGPQKEDFYRIFIGRLKALDGGWLLPAGKRHDGEWMPDIYHIVNREDGEMEIMSVSYTTAWVLTRTHFALHGEDTVFFGSPQIFVDEFESRDFPLRVTLSFSDGTEASDELPPGYNYCMILSETGKTLDDIRKSNAVTGEEFSWDAPTGWQWWKEEGEARAIALYKNIESRAAVYATNSISLDELPKLEKIHIDELYGGWGTIYAANLYKDGTGAPDFVALAPAPLDEVYREQVIPVRVGPGGRAGVTIDYGDWGAPTKVDAVLYTPEGTRELSYKNIKDNSNATEYFSSLMPEYMYWQINTDEKKKGEWYELKQDAWYMLMVRAEFGDKGFMQWTVPLSR